MTTTITKRAVKGAALTWAEEDANIENLRTALDNNIASTANAILALQAGQQTGMLGFTTKALMDADLAHSANTPAIVTNDATSTNNAFYIKIGASGAGSWQKSTMPPSIPIIDARNYASFSAAVAALGSVNPYVLLVSTVMPVTSSMSVTANILVSFQQGGMLDISSGQTVTFARRPCFSGKHQVFSGAGSVAGVGELDVIHSGAAADGVTDDFAAFQKGAAAAGSTGVLQLGEPKTYKIAGTRPRLQDSPVYISAVPGAAISMDPNPGLKLNKFLSPVKLGTRYLHRNSLRDTTLAWAGSAAAAALMPRRSATIGNFATDFSQYSISSRYTVVAGTASVSAGSVWWPTPFGSGVEGVFRAPAANCEASELTFIHIGPVVGGGPYVAAHIVGNLYRYIVAFPENATSAIIYRHDGTTVMTIPLPNTLGYTIVPTGSLTLGIRILERRYAEIYANDLHLLTFDITAHDGNSSIDYYGYGTTWQLSGKMNLQLPFFHTTPAPHAAKPVQIAILGDSIAYAAFATMDMGEHLIHILSQMPGFGAVTVRNRAVPGASTGSWIAGATYTGDGGSTTYSLATEDFTSDRFVLVLIGTNDCQGSVTTATFSANLATIANKIISDGSIPIFGIPAGWLASVGANYTNIARYRAAVRSFCTTNGYQVAEVGAAMGSNSGWYYDGIHPHEEGQVALAQAFASALVAAGSPRIAGNVPLTTVAAYTNSWVAYGSSTFRDASYERIGDEVRLSGMMKSGVVGPSGSSAFTLPVNCRPKRRVLVTCPSYNGTTYLAATIHIQTTGAVEVWGGGNTWLSLDGISFGV